MFYLDIKSSQKIPHIYRLPAIDTTVFRFLPHFIFLYARSSWHTIFNYTFSNLLIFPLILIYTFICIRTFFFTLFQFTRQLHTDLIESSIFFHKRIHHINHLIKDLLNHWLPKLVLFNRR